MQLNTRLKFAWRGGWTAVFSTLIGCATPITEYEDNSPTLDTSFFLGDLTAQGIVRDWSGKVIRYFTATLQGYRQGDGIVLDELFYYSDGEEQTRQWTFGPLASSQFTATAPDVPGQAVGKVAGNAMYLKYALTVDMASGTQVTLDAEDELFRVSETTVLSDSILYKLGVPMARVSLVIRRAD